MYLSTREGTCTLISLMKNHECLWNKRLRSYYNKALRDEAWESIFRAMQQYCEGLTVRDVRSKVWSLRGQYMRERRRKAIASSNGKMCKKWEYYDELDFLGSGELNADVASNMARMFDKPKTLSSAHNPRHCTVESPSHILVSVFVEWGVFLALLMCNFFEG